MSKNVLLIVVACLCSQVAFAEYTGPRVSSNAAACDSGEEPCVQLWSQMSSAERAKLWPFLDEDVRLRYWRHMNQVERKSLLKKLCFADRERLRSRYTNVGMDHTEDMSARGQGAGKHFGKLGNEERHRMREQIIEVHMELRAANGHRMQAHKESDHRP